MLSIKQGSCEYQFWSHWFYPTRNQIWACSFRSWRALTTLPSELFFFSALEMLQEINASEQRRNNYTLTVYKSLLDYNLAAKYSLTGHLAPHNVITDGFYDVGQVQCYVITCFQIKFSLWSRYYAEACNEWQGPSSRFSAWTTQLRWNFEAVASRWWHCFRFDRLGNQT